MPRAYIDTILSSKPGKRRWYLAVSCGTKVASRPRGFASWRDHPWFLQKPMSKEDWLELEAWHCRAPLEETEEPPIELPADWGPPG
jgi:hypothetical protein